MRLLFQSILFLFVFGLGSNVSAQTFDFKKAEEHIIALSTLILTDQDETARVQACDSIKVLLQSTLSAP
ncbi:MAG: hypothetical protein ABIV51_07560, partial [Saprospiraceae bacterium]